MPNLLSKILVVPAFLSDDECERVLASVAGNEAAELGIAGQRLQPLSPAFSLSDIADPGRALARLRAEPLAQLVVAKYAAPEALARLAAAVDLRDLDEDLGRSVVVALERAVSDPRMFTALPGPPRLPPGSASEAALADLLEDGTLHRVAGEIVVIDDPGPAARLALAWFHISVLEDVVFGDTLMKGNRVTLAPFSRAVRAGLLASGPLAEAIARAGGADLLASRRVDDASLALHRIFDDQERCIAFLGIDAAGMSDAAWPAAARDLLATCPERRRTGTTEDDVARWVAQTMLQRHAPDLFRPPLSATFAGGIRSTRSVADAAAKAGVQPYLARLRRDHVDPHYGIHCADEPAEVDILEYVAGGYYVPHTDACSPEDRDGVRTWIKTLPRDVSVILYLSRAEEFGGGALSFPDLHVAVRPQRGMAVVFPSDHRFAHCVETVTHGKRAAVVAWMCCAESSPTGAPFEVRW